MIALPCISYFDMHTYGNLHNIFAGLFFGSCFFYIYFVVDSLVKHKNEFPQTEWDAIDRASKFRWIMCGSLVFYIIWKIWLPETDSMFYEWVLTFEYLNALSIINLANGFYDTVHDGVPTTP